MSKADALIARMQRAVADSKKKYPDLAHIDADEILLDALGLAVDGNLSADDASRLIRKFRQVQKWYS